VIAQLKAMDHLSPRLQRLLERLERLEQLSDTPPTLKGVLDRLHTANEILSTLKTHGIVGADRATVDGLVAGFDAAQHPASATFAPLGTSSVTGDIDLAEVADGKRAATGPVSAASHAQQVAHHRSADHRPQGDVAPANGPPPLPSPNVSAGGASGAAAGLGGAAMTAVALLALAAALMRLVFDSRLLFAPARWKPVTLAARLERPG
jgi:hypothetical protein